MLYIRVLLVVAADLEDIDQYPSRAACCEAMAIAAAEQS